jgi:hypothetical protein
MGVPSAPLESPGRQLSSACLITQIIEFAPSYGRSCVRLLPSQLISLRYGTVPIVRETGGLVDTVIDVAHRWVCPIWVVREIVKKRVRTVRGGPRQTRPLSLSLSHTHTHMRSLSLSHTLTQTHAHAHAQRLPRVQAQWLHVQGVHPGGARDHALARVRVVQQRLRLVRGITLCTHNGFV